ncbi:smoothelin-like protein 1 isoform X4 [Pollicipes pollicipes]|uniref:smoothelin-like protein 1 isoform X4 n=1 Tax=Pollicipes pollicipes TaxID=41117 RepID=UPI001885715E|nr:smoothelin-like protein 1 isoform X4 [Pollicipes pollicipes]
MSDEGVNELTDGGKGEVAEDGKDQTVEEQTSKAVGEKDGEAAGENDDQEPDDKEGNVAAEKEVKAPDESAEDKPCDEKEDKVANDSNVEDVDGKDGEPPAECRDDAGKATEEKEDEAADEGDAQKADAEPAAATEPTPAAGETVIVSGVNISEVTDQDKLHEMLEQCDNFDERKKIRARLMTLMQEARARRELASRRRLQHQQQRDGGSVSQHEAKMINEWLQDNFEPDVSGAFSSSAYRVEHSVAYLSMVTQGKDSPSDSKMASSSSSVTAKTSSSKTVASSQRSQLTKGKAPVSAFDKFKQLDSANPRAVPRTDSTSSDGGGGFKLDAGLAAKAQGAKEMTLYWCQCRTRDYQNVNIENFSTSWNDGMAFCALIHHFYPDAFDFEKLNPKNRRYNFDLAFKTADEKAGIFPLLDTDDMVAMRKPDWKCVFTYVQAIYRRLKDGPCSP